MASRRAILRANIAQAVVLALTAAMAVPAAAQDVVVMRRVLAAPAPITYTGIYSQTYGACVGGTQTAPVVSCRSSRGATVANSNCQPTTSRTCTAPSCGVPIVGYWTNGSSIGSSYALGVAASAQEAQQKCNAKSPDDTSICIWETNSRNASLITRNAVTAFPGRTDLYAASCR